MPTPITPRTRVPKRLRFSGTTNTISARLSFTADLALNYSIKRLVQAGSRLPSTSAVIRRALELYAERLSAEGFDVGGELWAVAAVSDSLLPDDVDRAAANARLAHEGPLPAFQHVLHSPEWHRQWEGFDERAEAISEAVLRERRGGRRAPQKGKAQETAQERAEAATDTRVPSAEENRATGPLGASAGHQGGEL